MWYPDKLPGGESAVYEPGSVLPDAPAELPTGAHRIEHPDYTDIQWTYQDVPAVTCNGIRIMRSFEDSQLAEWILGPNVWRGKVESPFSKIWMEVLSRAVIPYDAATRKRVLRQAFKRLSSKTNQLKVMPAVPDALQCLC